MTARLLVATTTALLAALGSGVPVSASVPGAEGRIAFASSRSENSELYSVWPDGSSVRRLTWTSANEQSPAWSPDAYASKIAYESDESGRLRIHVMDWDGRNQRRVSPAGSELDEDVHPTWAPGASRIAFASTRGGGWHIWTMNVDGTGARRLTDGSGVEPAWAPLGAWIAYAWDESIWLVNTDGSHARRLTAATGRAVSAPAWSPDSSEIVFSRVGPDGLPGELFVASVFVPGQERQLTTGGFANARASWSPDSSEIVFQRLSAAGGWHLLAIPAGGGAVREVQPSGGGDLSPAWGSSLSVPGGFAPAPPTIHFFSPTEGETFYQGLGQGTRALYVCTSESAVIVSCDGDVALGSNLDTSTAGSHTITVTATDHDGRTATSTVTYHVVDIIAPHIELRTPTNGAAYTLGERVTVDYSCTDAGGAIEFCGGTLPPGEPLPTDTPGTYTFTVFAVDEAHNVTEAVAEYRVADLTPPSIAISTPAADSTFTLGAPIPSSFTCEDDSRIAECLGPSTVATDAIGTHTFTVTATDDHGNTLTASHTYNVVYSFSGFFAPLASASTGFAAGETIPVKFALDGNQGLAILAPGSPTWRHVACGSPARDGSAQPARGRLSYNRSNGRYLYLLETEASWAGSCRELTLTLDDRTAHHAVIAFAR